jgi:hypothetical protein
MESKKVAGACLCAAVRFEVELPTLFCAHCHCGMCRRAHGAGYVTWLVVARRQFRIVAGAGELARYESSLHGVRSFCRICGSSLFFATTQRPDQIDVALANMDEPIDRAPEFHIFIDDKADWVQVGDDLPRLGGPTGLDPKR